MGWMVIRMVMRKELRMKEGDVGVQEYNLMLDNNTPFPLAIDDVVYIRVKNVESREVSVNAVCSVVDLESGIVGYMWREGEAVAGMYEVEFRVESVNGDIVTIPSGGRIWLWIMEGINV